MSQSNKARVGFTTSATCLEDRFEKVRRQLSSKKVVWHEIYNSFDDEKMQEQGRELTKQALKDHDTQTAHFLLLSRTMNLAVEMIARLGMEVAETHERLTKCEKTIEELKLAMK